MQKWFERPRSNFFNPASLLLKQRHTAKLWQFKQEGPKLSPEQFSYVTLIADIAVAKLHEKEGEEVCQEKQSREWRSAKYLPKLHALNGTELDECSPE